MALSYAMHWIEDNGHARLTNYGEFLAKFPPRVGGRGRRRHLLELRPRRRTLALQLRLQRRQARLEPGVARAPARGPRLPARRHRAARREACRGRCFNDLWAARDAYIDVVLDRSASIARTASSRATPPTSSPPRRARHRARAAGAGAPHPADVHQLRLVLRRGLRHRDRPDHRLRRPRPPARRQALRRPPPAAALEAQFLAILAAPNRNLPEIGDGAEHLPPLRHHHAHRPGPGGRALRHQLHLPQLPRRRRALLLRRPPRLQRVASPPAAAKSRSAAPSIRSRITEETEEHLLRRAPPRRPEPLRRRPPLLRRRTPKTSPPSPPSPPKSAPPSAAPTCPRSSALIDRFFGTLAYSLTSLFADEQHRILRTILDRTLAEMEDSLRKIYEDHASLLRFLTESGMAAPPALAHRRQLRHQLQPAPRHRGRKLRPRRDRGPVRPRRRRPGHRRHPAARFAAGERMKRAMVALEAAATSDRAMLTALRTALAIATGCAPCPSTSTCGRRRTSGTTSSAAATRTTGRRSGSSPSKNSAKPSTSPSTSWSSKKASPPSNARASAASGAWLA